MSHIVLRTVINDEQFIIHDTNPVCNDTLETPGQLRKRAFERAARKLKYPHLFVLRYNKILFLSKGCVSCIEENTST